MRWSPWRSRRCATSLPLRREREGEQQLKTVTMLFMDIVGSTQLSQYLDPEDVHAVMDTALERLRRWCAARTARS